MQTKASLVLPSPEVLDLYDSVIFFQYIPVHVQTFSLGMVAPWQQPQSLLHPFLID